MKARLEHLDGVDVVARSRAVERRREMLPLPDRRVAAGVEVAGEAIPERQVVARREMVDPEHRPGPGPAAEDPDVVLRARLLHPRLEREAGVVERAEAGQFDVVVGAVERQCAAEAPRRPRRTDDRAVLARAGRVHGRRAGALVERIRGDEPGRRRVRQGRGGQRHGDDAIPIPSISLIGCSRSLSLRHAGAAGVITPALHCRRARLSLTTLRRPGSTYPTDGETVTRRSPGTWRSRPGRRRTGRP